MSAAEYGSEAPFPESRHPDWAPMEKNAQDQAERQKELRQKRLYRAYKRTFDTPEGQIVLRDLAGMTQFFDPTYAPGMDAVLLGVRAARRDVFLYLLNMARMNEEEIHKIKRVEI